MICNLFLKMRTRGEHVTDPACGIVTVSRPLLDKLTRLSECAQAVYAVGGFSVSFLCGFAVYDDADIPDDAIWQRIIDRLDDEEALVVWTAEPISWNKSFRDVCLATSYGRGNIVFQSTDDHGGGWAESDFVALSDIRKWVKRDDTQL